MKTHQRKARNGFRRQTQFTYGRLEPKNLLAGDVFVQVSDFVLTVVGDALSNQVQIDNADGGDLTISGLNTTVNGSVDSFRVSQPFQHITIALNGGNDEFTLRDTTVPSHLTFLGGQGDDRATFEDISAYHFHFDGGTGADVFDLSGTVSRKSSYIYMGSGDDVVAATSHFAGRNFKVFGGDGDDLFVSDSLSVGRKFSVHLNNGADQVLIAGETFVSKRTRITTGNGNDLVAFNPGDGESVQLNRWIRVDTGNGDDSVVTQGDIDFSRFSRFSGGPAIDQLQRDGVEFDDVRIRNFEGNSVDDFQETLDAIFERLSNAALNAAPFGGPADPGTSEELSLLITNAALNIIENDPPTAIDSTLDLTGDLEVESARVELNGFGAEQDVLTFDETAGITGVFDSSTGVIAFTGDGSTASYQQVLRSVRYENISDNPTSDERLVTFTVFDELANPVTDDRTLSIQRVDDPLSLTLPSPFDSDVAIIRNVGQTIEFVAIGDEPDNEFVYQLDLDESNIPAAAAQPTIDSETGQFNWTPDSTGNFFIRVIAINDLGQADQEEFTLTIS